MNRLKYKNFRKTHLLLLFALTMAFGKGIIKTLGIALLVSCMPAIALCSDETPWWIVETAMRSEGELRMDGHSWWSRAQALAVGEQFLIKSELPHGGWMLVRREAVIRGSGTMIVWILDDDGDMDPNEPRGDHDSDCYVVSDEGSGAVDQMVDWIDLDGDQVPDRMEMRYFRESRLRTAIFMEDHDDDGVMQPVTDYRRKINHLTSFLIDAYGNNMYFHQKYDPEKGVWIPISECPFAFHDTDGDGASEVVLRFATTPINFDVVELPDYGNSWRRMLGPWLPEMERMAVANIRYSFDIDNLSTRERPTHYEMGFNLLGRLPYSEIEGVRDMQPLSRPPQTTVHIPFKHTCELGNSYAARATGFSWHEFADGSIAIGDPRVDQDWDRRWEGVFWTWNRIFMDNTGGPNQTFNMRREYNPNPTTSREVYYSSVDGRLHLKGAREGFTRLGAIGGREPLGEVRTFDTDRNGYFDRWEYYVEGEGWPWLVAEPHNAVHEDFGDDWSAMAEHYNTMLPRWIAQWKKLISTLKDLNDFQAVIPTHLKEAQNNNLSPGEQRYLLEHTAYVLYRQWRAETHRQSLEQADTKMNEIFSDMDKRVQMQEAWKAATLLTHCDRLLGAGELDALPSLIRETWQLLHRGLPSENHDEKKN
jgi:hypothetical protein